ncbi:hypothetical protein Godav_024746, partial [Gossypium davidsonii]|nr:hypothetical protein [Gossypium davidsonii]
VGTQPSNFETNEAVQRFGAAADIKLLTWVSPYTLFFKRHSLLRLLTRHLLK